MSVTYSAHTRTSHLDRRNRATTHVGRFAYCAVAETSTLHTRMEHARLLVAACAGRRRSKWRMTHATPLVHLTHSALVLRAHCVRRQHRDGEQRHDPVRQRHEQL